MAVHAGANQYTGPAYSAKAVVGNITTRYSQQRQAGWLGQKAVCVYEMSMPASQSIPRK